MLTIDITKFLLSYLSLEIKRGPLDAEPFFGGSRIFFVSTTDEGA